MATTREFFEALFNYPDYGSYIQLRYGDRFNAPPEFVTSIDEALTIVDTFKGYPNHQVFFGVLPTDEPTWYIHDVHSSGRVLWVDMDLGKAPEGAFKAHLLEVLDWSGAPRPSIIVDSGHGYHCYWILDTDYPTDQIVRYNTMLKDALLGGDNCQNPNRILRVPGTINWKDGVGTLCSIYQFTPERVYSLDSFPILSALPETVSLVTHQSDVSLPSKEPFTIQEFIDRLQTTWATGKWTLWYKDVMTKGSLALDPSNPYHGRYFNGNKPDRSLLMWSLMGVMQEAGMSPGQIVYAFTNPEWGCAELVLKEYNGISRLRRTMQKRGLL